MFGNGEIILGGTAVAVAQDLYALLNALTLDAQSRVFTPFRRQSPSTGLR
jgi:hypothetical protein